MVRKIIDLDGNIRYYNEQFKLHREDGPALEYSNGDKFWIVNDSYHRLDGPALEYASGDRCYYIMGKQYSYENWLAIKDFPLLW